MKLVSSYVFVFVFSGHSNKESGEIARGEEALE